MKRTLKNSKLDKKLTVNTETVRQLDAGELAQAGGASGAGTNTCGTCLFSYCPRNCGPVSF
jgi:hypothetical protein